MTRPRRSAPAADQPALIDGPRARKRRVELATDKAIRAAGLEDTDAAAAALARALARAVDDASEAKEGRRADPYGIAAAARELREILARLQLDPASRGAGLTDDLAAALAELARPSV